MRIALCGASGTGKTTLTSFLQAATTELLLNPVGSRSVSLAMGFASPYEVDKAGKRAEFQRRLIVEKRAWEDAHERFVTDRTTLDNLAYTMLHDIHTVDEALLTQIVEGLGRYTHVIYCPVEAFCNPGGDTARIQDMTYHKLYDSVVRGLLSDYLPSSVAVYELELTGKEARQVWATQFIQTMEMAAK